MSIEFPPICNRDIHHEPDIYFELTDQLYKESPDLCKHRGGLHSSRLPRVTSVERLEASTHGVYLKWNLHAVPHYQLPVDRRMEVEELLKKNNKPLKVFSRDRSYIDEGDIAIFNGNTPEFEKWASFHHSRLDFDGILKRLIGGSNESIPVSDRGNVAVSVGFATLNQKLSGDDEITSPQIIRATDSFYVTEMCKLSDLIADLEQALPSKGQIFGDDTTRIAEFAGSLPSRFGLSSKDNYKNKIEAATFAVTCLGDEGVEEPISFKCHLDQFNDKQRGWNVVCCAFQHIRFMGKLYRVAIIGYSRASIRHYYLRQRAAQTLKKNLKRYYKHDNGRSSILSASKCIPRDGKVKYVIPFFDKCAYYSAFVSSLRALLMHYTSIQNYPRLAELLLPMGWLSSPAMFDQCYSDWLTTGLSDRNLSIAFIDFCMEQHQSILKGKGQRCQSSFNFSFRLEKLLESLSCLSYVLEMGDQEGMSFDEAFKILSGGGNRPGLFGVGGLGIHTILAVASLSGAIKNQSFATDAVLCRGTLTAKKLLHVYGIGPASANRILSNLADELEITKATAENLICEYFWDNDVDCDFDPVKYEQRKHGRTGNGRIILHPDSFFPGQSIFRCERDPSSPGKYRIIQSSLQHTTFEETNSEISYFDLGHTPADHTAVEPWWDPFWRDYDPKMIIKVTHDSKLRSSPKARIPRNSRTIIPSGFASVEQPPRKVSKLQDQCKSDPEYLEDEMYHGKDLYKNDDEPYIGHLTKVDRAMCALISRRRLRSISVRSLDILVHIATKADQTFRFLDLSDECKKIFSCKSADSMRYKKKNFLRSIPTKFQGNQYFTARFEGNTYATLSDRSVVPFFTCGLVRIHNKIRLYKTSKHAVLAVAIEILVKSARMKDQGQSCWSKRLLRDDRMNTVNDYCVIYSSQYWVQKDHPIGILFFRQHRRCLAVPTGQFMDSWQIYCLEDSADEYDANCKTIQSSLDEGMENPYTLSAFKKRKSEMIYKNIRRHDQRKQNTSLK